MWLRNVFIGGLITWGFIFAVMALSGCGMLVKKIDAWGLKIEFPEGYQAGVSANTVDHVIDRRGLNVSQKAERY